MLGEGGGCSGNLATVGSGADEGVTQVAGRGGDLTKVVLGKDFLMSFFLVKLFCELFPW